MKLRHTRVKYVAYYRVSTARQGRSKLGLEAQKATVAARIKESEGELVAEYTEQESGKVNSRPALQKAIDHARETGAILIIAKLDRLSRNIQFIFQLREAGVAFCACDMPELNTLTLGIYATVAQYERERICERIKDALKAKKARGETLGNASNFTHEHRVKGAKARKEKALQANQSVWTVIKGLRETGMSYRNVVSKLNELGLKTVTGKAFKLATVQRIVRMMTSVV